MTEKKISKQSWPDKTFILIEWCMHIRLNTDLKGIMRLEKDSMISDSWKNIWAARIRYKLGQEECNEVINTQNYTFRSKATRHATLAFFMKRNSTDSLGHLRTKKRNRPRCFLDPDITQTQHKNSFCNQCNCPMLHY